MGCFTFTDARVKSPRRNKWGDYTAKDKIGYGGYIKVVCPDGTVYEDDHYDGYGNIGIHDIYDLVVDWNRTDLADILELRKKHVFYRQLKDIVEKFIRSGYDEVATTAYVKALVADGKCAEYLIGDWKRNIGIMLACEDEDNKTLRFPVKVTRSRENVKYDDLHISWSTQ